MRPVEPDLSAHDFRNHDRRRRRRTPGIDRRVEEMRAHRHRQVPQRRKWREIVFEIAARSVDDRQLVMAIHARPAMPRHVLDDGRDPARKKPFGDRPAHRRDAFGPRRERPRADGRMHALIGDIEHRRAVDGDSDFDEIMSDEASDQTRRGLGLGRLQARFYRGRSRVRTPMRRRHALDPAALLIDQHRRVSAANAFPERPRQRTHLIPVGDVALEEDQAPRVFATQEGAFLVTEREAGAAADEGLGHLRLRGSDVKDGGPSLT